MVFVFVFLEESSHPAYLKTTTGFNGAVAKLWVLLDRQRGQGEWQKRSPKG